MKQIVLACLLVMLAGSVTADLAWPEPVEVCAFDNVQLINKSAFTPDGYHLVAWLDDTLGEAKYRLRLYDQQYQELWTLALQQHPDIYLFHMFNIFPTSDSCFVVLVPDNGIRALKISRTGDMLWSEQGIPISFELYDGINLTAAPDGQGGLYFLWGSRFPWHAYPYQIQHLDANGIPTMPLPGMIWEGGGYCQYKTLIMQQDNSVIVSWVINNRITINNINSMGQFLWPQAVILDYPAGIRSFTLCGFQDGSFALGYQDSTNTKIQRFTADGGALWADAVTAITVPVSNNPAVNLKLSSHNLLMVLLNNGGKLYFQRLSMDGTVLLPEPMILDASDDVAYGSVSMLPDDSEGARVITMPDILEQAPTLAVFRISATNLISCYTVPTNVCWVERYVAGVYGSETHLVWQKETPSLKGFCAQVLGPELGSIYPGEGLPLNMKSQGDIYETINLAARDNGAVAVYNVQQSSDRPKGLYVQLFDAEGQALYGNQGVLLSGTCSTLEQPCVGSSNTLVAWIQREMGVYHYKLQIINPDGSFQFPAGGLEFHSGYEGSTVLKADYHDGDWYLVWSNEMTLWGQKLSGNQLMWGDGLQLTQVHPNHNTFIWSFRLEWPWLIWQPLTLLVKRLEPDGSTSPGFPEYGLEMPPTYQGWTLLDQHYTPFGENLHALLSYHSPDGPPVETLYVQNVISPQGEFINAFTAVDVGYNANVFSHGNEVYIGDYDNQYHLRRFDANGQLLQSGNIPITGFANDGWQVISARFVINGNIQLLVYGDRQGKKELHYYHLNPQWGLITPTDNPICSYFDDYWPSVSHLGDRSWIVWGIPSGIYFAGSSTVYLQCLELDGSAAADPVQQIPLCPLVENCRPNPFNPATTIDFSVPWAGHAKLGIYDLKGRKIRTLLDKKLPSGKHSVVWDGMDDKGLISASGIYFLRLDAGGKHHVRKVSLVK